VNVGYGVLIDRSIDRMGTAKPLAGQLIETPLLISACVEVRTVRELAGVA